MLFFLRDIFIRPRLNAALAPVQAKAVDAFARLYLAGDSKYSSAERAHLLSFYNRNVRLVHAGAALNNAEIMIPKMKGSVATWSARPSYNDIVQYKVGDRLLMNGLRQIPSVGLIFIRKQNDTLANGLPSEMEIEVSDRFSNKGLIVVRKTEGRPPYTATKSTQTQKTIHLDTICCRATR